MRWEHAAQQLATTAWTRCKSLVGVETISTRDLPRLHCWASKLVPQEFTRQNGEAFLTQQKRFFFVRQPTQLCQPTQIVTKENQQLERMSTKIPTTSTKQPRDAYKAASALLKPAGLAATKAAMMELTCAFNDGIVENPVVISDQQPTGFVQKLLVIQRIKMGRFT